MNDAKDPQDPKSLIREAFNMPHLGAPECRSIFLDWALSLPHGMEPKPAIRALLDRYGPDHPGHPMTAVLTEGLEAPARTGRRGGRGARKIT